MLRKKWKLNGEPFIFSGKDNLLNGQNRCFALLRAEKLRKQDPERYKKYGVRGPIKIPALIVRGVLDSSADTIDQGAARTNADVIFREKLFDDYKTEDNKPEFSAADKKKLARYLATAVRVVWVRVGGNDVLDVLKFPVSAMEDFLKRHPAILDCLLFCYRQDGGVDKNIASLVSVPYMTAAMYLAATIRTDREEYDKAVTQEEVHNVVDLGLMEKVEVFVMRFASASNLDTGSPILSLRKAFDKIKGEKISRDRSVTLNMLIKAFAYFLDDVHDVTVKDALFSPAKDATPRLGGLDVEQVEPDEETPEEDAPEEDEEEEAATPKKTKKKARRPGKKPVKARRRQPVEEEAV
jgi:hypothetical protein